MTLNNDLWSVDDLKCKHLNMRAYFYILNPWSPNDPELMLNMNDTNQEKTLAMSRLEREREEMKEKRRHDILSAAEKLFLSQGFDEATMQDIADEAEYSKGTLYNYYKSKDELYIAIGSKAYRLIIEYTKEFTEKEKAGIKQIMAIGYAYYEFTKKYPDYASIFHDIAVKFPDITVKPKSKLSLIEKEYLSLSNSYRDIFIKILSDAMKDKAIRADKNPNMIGYVLSTVTRGIVEDLSQSENVVKRLGLNSDEIIDFIFEILGDGLKPR
ncbi:MAG: TetR/AcrR family transcriptional regulator [Promethearchaeota archaeon]